MKMNESRFSNGFFERRGFSLSVEFTKSSNQNVSREKETEFVVS